MRICGYSYKKYLRLIKSFHGNLAPGMIIGGYIVDMAMRNLPAGELFDVVCETSNCLPDAVQILTPCTVGNGWLSIVNLGRFAVTIYEKYNGAGVRVYMDTEKLDNWPIIRAWYLKEKKKDEQDPHMLIAQIREAGHAILSSQHVQVDLKKVRRGGKGQIRVCPVCREAYPLRDGDTCRSCQGETPYTGVIPG